MLGKTHAIMGLLLGLALVGFFPYLSFTETLGVLFFCVFGSLFPDIDSSTSLIGRHTPIVSFLVKHRGIFHSIFPLIIIVFGLIYFARVEIIIAFILGFFSHLILDMFTKQGLTLYPFKTRIKGPIIVGSLEEHVFFLSQIIIILIVLFI